MYRLRLTRVDAAISIDALLEGLRGFTARTAAELAARGGGPPGVTLDDQMRGLEAWHSYTMQSLRTFKVYSPFTFST
jgi:hypothetical protein